MIHFLCPNCDKKLRHNAAHATVRCPRCGQHIVVPEPPASNNPAMLGKLTSEAVPPVRAKTEEEMPVEEIPIQTPEPMLEHPEFDAPPPTGLPRYAWALIVGVPMAILVGIIAIAIAASSESDRDNVKRSPAAKTHNDTVAKPQPREQRSSDDDAEAGKTLKSIVGLPFLILFLLIGLLFYMMPTIIAWYRKHPNLPAIGALNLLLGWLFVGWVAALVWAFTVSASRDSYHYHYHDQPPQP
jgi:DNA-directed RNA polymerase subunit RPC12/RpoP